MNSKYVSVSSWIGRVFYEASDRVPIDFDILAGKVTECLKTISKTHKDMIQATQGHDDEYEISICLSGETEHEFNEAGKKEIFDKFDNWINSLEGVTL